MPEHKRKPGRPGREPAEGERVGLSLRVTPQVKRSLDSAAAHAGRSLSQEAELRLERSFQAEDLLPQLLTIVANGREAGVLMEVIGRGLRDAGAHAAASVTLGGEGTRNWLNNAAGFAAAAEAAATVLSRLKPEGELSKAQAEAARHMGRAVANGLLNALAKPADEGDFMESWAAPIRPRLGVLAERLRGFEYDVAAQSAVLPSDSLPGVLIYDSDNPELLPGEKS